MDKLVPIKRLRCQSNRCQPVGDEDMWAAMAFHCFPEEFQGSLGITALCDKAFEQFPFMIHSPPKIVRLAVDLHERLVQVPLPVCPRPHSFNPSAADLSGKHRPKSVPPKPDGFVTDLNASLVQQIFDIAKRKWEPDVQHHCKADVLGARLEIS
jgi:hypothetical protein